ncbi:hypothetical protein M5K25_015398 [Dendrobium thyrsiflorum]|uniref:Uncharacterized protein n=1 Tax=Dendrobium thyrsiflorum TaxID=117978 RepID=A0ABD0UQ60_DENTH
MGDAYFKYTVSHGSQKLQFDYYEVQNYLLAFNGRQSNAISCDIGGLRGYNCVSTVKSVVPSCMADPELDHEFVYNDQGHVDILNSPFFDVNLEIDRTVEEYVERITFSLVAAIDEQLSLAHFKSGSDPMSSSFIHLSTSCCKVKEVEQGGNRPILGQYPSTIAGNITSMLMSSPGEWLNVHHPCETS